MVEGSFCLKKKYIHDYEPYFEQNDKGELKEKLHYKGDRYELDVDENTYKKQKIQYLFLTAVLVSIYFFMGMISHPGDRVFYIIYPYLIPIIPIYYLLQSVLTLPKDIHQMELVTYDTTFLRIRRSIIGIEVVVFLLIIGDIFYIITSGIANQQNLVISEGLFLLLSIIIFLILLLFLVMHIKLIKNTKIHKYTE